MTVPIYLLSGFLGSGKTTLLTQMVEQAQQAGLTPAVLMNELGEVNLDGQLIKKDIAMAEVLGGCICCSMKGDLTMELHQLIENYAPDLIIVESTGAAHPMESIDAITETSLYHKAVLQEVITVVDSEHFLTRTAIRKDQTAKLMKEQITCATKLILNKIDRLDPEQKIVIGERVKEINPYALTTATSHCKLDQWDWLIAPQTQHKHVQQVHLRAEHASEQHHTNHSHQHVMAYTHYWKAKPNSEAFEAWLNQLPKEIYRAKGIVTFSDIPSRFLFQFAFRESDFMRIEPQGNVHDVAVFIGEHFDQEWLKQQLQSLEQNVQLSDE